MDTDEEKKADLFAAILEYRDAIRALGEFSKNYGVTVSRRWPIANEPPGYVVVIGRYNYTLPISEVYEWKVQGSGDTLQGAVGDAVRFARALRAKVEVGS